MNSIPDVLFRRLVDDAPDALVIADSEGRIILVNAQAEKLLGYARAELNGKYVEELMPERYRQGHLAHRAGYAHEPKVRGMGAELELFVQHKDGREIPVEISLSPIATADRWLISTAIRDVGARRRAERAAKLANEQLLSAIESFHGALALFDSEDRLSLCNRAASDLFAPVLARPLVGIDYADLIDVCVASGFFAAVSGASSLRERLLDYHRNPTGTLDVRLSTGAVLRLASRRMLEGGIISTMVDVSEDAMLQTELRAARAQAEAASSAKSEYLSSMSHELRTPLNAILGFAQLLKRDKRSPLSPAQREKLDHVLHGGEHLLRLIDDVLDLSRIEAGRVIVSPERVQLAPLLDDVRQTLEPMAKRAGIALRVEPPPENLPDAFADRTRVKQVLINFGSNAIKYNKPHGSVEIRAERIDDARLRIVVKDDGIGIPTEQQGKVFQPFQRAGQEFGPIEGTGIGLSITRRLAELMDGSVGFSSSPGQGSTFWLQVPLHFAEDPGEASSPSSARHRSTPAEPSGAAVTILHIEDNPSNLAFMEGVFEELPGVRLISAPNAELGIELARQLEPRCVLMDLNLPGMNGVEAAARLREDPRTKGIPIIALTAAAMLGERCSASEAGFAHYLTKPVKVEELIAALEPLLRPED